jgi:hypothetical protein
MELRAGFLREIARPCRLRVGNGKKFDGGVLRGETRAQPADAAGADDGDAQFPAFDDGALLRSILAGASPRLTRTAPRLMLESRRS